jgi:hypothetical protein
VIRRLNWPLTRFKRRPRSRAPRRGRWSEPLPGGECSPPTAERVRANVSPRSRAAFSASPRGIPGVMLKMSKQYAHNESIARQRDGVLYCIHVAGRTRRGEAAADGTSAG